MWIFSPGLIFLALCLFLLTSLSQGKDIIYQSTDGDASWRTGIYLILATVFWVFTTWYTSRLIAYNRNDLFKKSPRVLYHFPRLLGFCIFLVLWLAVYLIDDLDRKRSDVAWAIALSDLAVYYLAHRFLEKSLNENLTAKRRRILVLIRWIVRTLILLACLLVVLRWKDNQVGVLLYTLPVFQLGFLFLVIARRPLYISDPTYQNKSVAVKSMHPRTITGRFLRWAFLDTSEKFDLQFEKGIFFFYNIIAALALVCYLLAINFLGFSRELTSFPFLMLAFGVLMGIINMIALVSHRRQVNFNFLLIVLIVCFGYIFETHPVRMDELKSGNEQVYARRLSFHRYIDNWLTWHRDSLDAAKTFPVFFVLADGGASRSGYWVASVLSALHEDTRDSSTTYHSYFTDHLFCLSGASGGSVGNTAFLSAYALQQRNPGLRTDTLCREYLGNDFLSFPLARMLGPELVHPLFGWFTPWTDRAAALEYSMDYPQGDGPMGPLVRGSFSQLMPNTTNRFPILSINTTRVNDGGPGVVGTIHIDSSQGIFGRRIDVLDSLPRGKDIRVSTSMILGARFPYMSPGGRIGNSYYVDGGYFDNSGAGVVHEMLIELNRMMKDTASKLWKFRDKLHFYVLHLSNTPYSPAASDRSIHPALNDLATPLLTLAGSYSSQTSVNDARLINYLKELRTGKNNYLLLNLYNKGKDASMPMNWVISERVRNIMNRRVKEKKEIDTLVRRMVGGRVENLFHGMGVEN
jgi:hypothetical protein